MELWEPKIKRSWKVESNYWKVVELLFLRREARRHSRNGKGEIKVNITKMMIIRSRRGRRLIDLWTIYLIKKSLEC